MANNPYINKVEYGGNVLIDLTQDTVTAAVLIQGYSAHDRSGAPINGGIPIQTSEELTAAGPTVTVPSGFYSTDAHKTIGSGTATTPTTTVTIAPGIAISTTGLITATIATTTQAITPSVVAGYISQGTAGNVTIKGSATNQLSVVTASTYHPSTSDQTIASQKFITGTQTIQAVRISDGTGSTTINASNIKSGIVVNIGDADDYDRILGVTGTFTDSNTVSSGQTAAGAGQILNGYSAFVDGAEVKGNIPIKTDSGVIITDNTVHVNPGYYSTDVEKSVRNGSATTPTTTITANPSITVGSDGTITATTSSSKSITPTVSAGWVSAGTAGTVTVTGTKTTTINHNFVGNDAIEATILGSLSIDPDTGVASVTFLPNDPNGDVQYLNSRIAFDQSAITPGWFNGDIYTDQWIDEQFNSTECEIHLTAESSQLPTQAATTITPTESQQTAVAKGKWTTGSVLVAAISSTYVGSGITQRTASDLTASGSVVTAPAGYYSASVTKAVAAGTATTPATTITATPTASLNSSTGVVTFSVSTNSKITPTVNAGYISSGTSGTVTVSGTSSLQLSVQTGKTVTPSETQQTAVAAGKYTTGSVLVAAISSTYVGSGITQRTAADLTASGSVVTAPAGYYSASVTKAVAAGSAKTPNTTITIGSANVEWGINDSTGDVYIELSKTQNITPTVTAGYVSTGTSGTITIQDDATIGYSLPTTLPSKHYTVVSGTNYTPPSVTISAGWLYYEDGTALDGTYSIPGVVYGNSATSGKTYKDISNTAAAPVLVTGDYLYINEGWTDNVKISLAKLVPDGASADLASNKILSGYAAYNNDGALIAGNIPSKAAATYTPTTSNQTISAGQYLSGAQTIKGDANLIAANIKAGVSLFGLTGTHQGGQISYTETDNEAGGKTVTIIFTGDT